MMPKLSKRAAKRARALAQQGANEKALPSRASGPPLRMPSPNKVVRISPKPLHRYAFFTPSAPLICSWNQPTRRDLMFGPGVARCEHILGYTFRSKVLLAEALNVELNGQFKLGTAEFFLPTNRRFAIYGDSLARTYLARQWLELGPSATGALWSITTGKVLSDQYFASIFVKLGMGRCVASAPAPNPPSDAKMDPNRLPKYMATTIEAIVAAAYIDGGDEALARVMERFGMDQHFIAEPAVYNFFRHGQSREDLPSPGPPSSPVPKAE
ncbi:hypothetical protein PG985_007657 [Apiospora marii]|uniref:RNase III domain-containing protein n=1 Tax=Apiospora marii TaxID=335849 RepID=A0ABR1SQV1_9PEZI